MKQTFWVDSYYWGTDLESLIHLLMENYPYDLRYVPAGKTEMYSAIRNRLESILPNHSEKICGKIITVR